MALRLLATLLAVVAPWPIFSQPVACDRKALAESGKLPFPYAIRSGGYCDGSIAFDHGAALQVISYTMGPVRYEPAQGRVKLQTVLASDVAPTIVGTDQRPGGSYRFDASLPAAGLEFDLTPAVHPKGIKAEDLGFVAWTMRNGTPVYVPVATGPRQAGDAPVLVMRAPIPVVQAAYQVCEDTGDCAKQIPWAANLAAGSRLKLILATSPTPRLVTLKFTVQGPGDRLVGEVVRVQIP